MSKVVPQKYPDLSRIRIVRFNRAIDAIIIHKSKSQYAISYKNPNTGTPYIDYRTENMIDREIAKAEIYDSPLYQLMQETEE